MPLKVIPAVVLDANVLVQAPVRDTLLRLAEVPALLRPLWSDEILTEVKRTLEVKFHIEPEAGYQALERGCYRAEHTVEDAAPARSGSGSQSPP